MGWLFGSDSDTQSSTTTINTDNRQVNTVDGGAIQGNIAVAQNALNLAGAAQVHAYDYADSLFHAAVDYANQNDGRQLDAFERAATITHDALLTANKAYSDASGELKAAYADAKGTTDAQAKIILAVVAVAGVMALAAMRAKG
jgi:hypothetical protein